MGLSRWESSKKSFPSQEIPPHLTPSHLNLISYEKNNYKNTLYHRYHMATLDCNVGTSWQES